MAHPRRVCFAPTDVASYYSGLREGLEAIGIKSWFFCFEPSKYARFRPRSTDMWLERLVFWLGNQGVLHTTVAGRSLRELLMLPLRIICFVVAALCCDTFVFAFGKTFLRRVELPLLHALGRRIVFVFNGSDTRPAWMSGLFLIGRGQPNATAMAREIRRQQRCIRRIERYANEIVCHPLSAQLLTRPFVNHLRIGHPFSASELTAGGEMSEINTSPNEPLRILHAPTRPLQKGSLQLRSIIQHLHAAGLNIDYVELTNQPNATSLRALRECDLVVDQLFSDIPLAGFATEAAAFGKPCIVGGYGRDEIARLTRESPLPMVHFVHPDDMSNEVLGLIRDPERRAKIAAELKRFVCDEWCSLNVAQRFLTLLDGSTPPSWRVDPRGLRYWQGWGAPEDAVRRGIAALIAHAGPKTLGLEHNPELKAEVIRQAAVIGQNETPTA